MISNVHERTFGVPADVIGGLVDEVAEPDNRLWPSRWWFPMQLDAGLETGSWGGHGPVRYEVSQHVPGRRVEFAFESVFQIPVEGSHAFEVHPGPTADSSRLRHVLVVRRTVVTTAIWYGMIRPLHDAVLEDLLDNAAELVGEPRRATWSPAVRAIRPLLPWAPWTEVPAHRPGTS